MDKTSVPQIHPHLSRQRSLGFGFPVRRSLPAPVLYHIACEVKPSPRSEQQNPHHALAFMLGESTG